MSSVVLPNEIWIKIFSYLSHEDRKQARFVCKLWSHFGVLPEFMKNSKLVLRSDNINDIRECLEKTEDDFLPGWNYSNVTLKPMECTPHLDYILSRIGKYIYDVKLNEICAFQDVYTHCPNIHAMRIIFTTNCCNRRDMTTIDLERFKHLELVDIVCAALSQNITYHWLRQLRDTPTIHLKSLRIQYIYEHMGLLMEVLRKHANFLTELCLTFVMPPALPNFAWQSIFNSLCKLEKITISGNCHLQWLYYLFSSIPTSAPLMDVDLSGAHEADNFLMTIITQKWATKLKRLDLMFCTQIRDNGAKSLRYIRKNLRELNLSRCRHLSSDALFSGIAFRRNTVLRSLHLNDITKLSERSICLLTERLPNLELLSLQNAGNAVTDVALAYIFCNLTKLQTLVLDDCSHITDKGMLGLGELPYSVGRLKGLRRLSLIGCTHISNRMLREGLKSNELRHLELGYSMRITTSGIEHAIVNCPAIESFTACSCPQLDDETALKVALGWPRLRKVNFSNCNRLTLRALQYLGEHSAHIKYVEFYGIEALDAINVPEYLRTYKRKYSKANRDAQGENGDSESQDDKDYEDDPRTIDRNIDLYFENNQQIVFDQDLGEDQEPESNDSSDEIIGPSNIYIEADPNIPRDDDFELDDFPQLNYIHHNIFFNRHIFYNQNVENDSDDNNSNGNGGQDDDDFDAEAEFNDGIDPEELLHGINDDDYIVYDNNDEDHHYNNNENENAGNDNN